MNQGGFTLVELAVTLAVVGIVGAVAMPSILPGQTRSSAYAQVVEALQSAARAAARTGTRSEVLIEPERGRALTRLLDGSTNTVQFGPVSGGTARFTFSSTGRATGGPLRMTVDGRPILIGVDPWTGRVSVDAP